MASTLSSIAAKDGAAASVSGGILAVDKSGAGTGPFFAAQTLVDTQGVNTATIKAASTAPATTDTTIVVGAADGNLVTVGALADAAVAAGATGSLSAKLRSISRDIVANIVLAAGANIIGAVTQSGAWVLSAGAAIIGKVGIDQTTDGTTNAVRLLAETTKNIGVVRAADGSGNLITSTTGGLDVNIKSGLNLNGRQADAASAPCALSTEDVAILGITTETAPATDTALSGLNGRLQRIAQNITSMVAATLLIGGDVSAGSSDSGKPIKIGGIGHTANPSAVTDGQRVNSTFDKLGKMVVVGSIRDLKVQQFTTITSSVAETTVLTAVASTFLDVYGVIIENTSASSCKVTFKDATAGTTRFELTVPAGDTRGFMLPESGAYPQAVVNNNWTATCGTSLASIVITMLAVKNI